MADVNEREVFPVLQDEDGAGVVLDQVVDAVTEVAGLKGLIGVAFQDKDGKAILPTLTDDGKIPVDTEAFAGTKKNGTGIVLGVLNTETLVCEITGLTTSKTVDFLNVLLASTQTVMWKIHQINDAADTVLHSFITGPGQFSLAAKMDGFFFATGASGDQEINIMGTQLSGKASDMHASIAVSERAVS